MTAPSSSPEEFRDKSCKCDPFLEELEEMQSEKKSGLEMQQWLKDKSVDVSVSAINRFLQKWRQRRAKERVLQNIYSSAQQCKEVEAAFAENPAPALDMLIKLHRVLIVKYSTEGQDNPDLAKFSDQLTKTVLGCVNDQTRNQLREREIKLAEAKVAEARKSDQLKALEGCLERVRRHPDLKQLFQAAFDALKAKIKEAKQSM